MTDTLRLTYQPERLARRPWRVMEWVDVSSRERLAACVDAFPTLAEAQAACSMMMLTAPAWSVWVESAPEFPVLEVK